MGKIKDIILEKYNKLITFKNMTPPLSDITINNYRKRLSTLMDEIFYPQTENRYIIKLLMKQK